MTPNIKRFIHAFTELTPQERLQALEAIKRMPGTNFTNESYGSDRGLTNNNAINFSPPPGSCPKCGR